MTLTPGRTAFESPADAHAAVTNDGLIRRLMRFLGVELWLWVLEFQQKTGTGWPHWHLLIDLATLPNRRLDLARAWELWRDKWHVGGLDLQVKQTFIESIPAIFYITEYLVKYPEMGFPFWVRNSAGMRFFQGCQKLGPILTDRRAETVVVEESGNPDAGERKMRSRRRCLAEREAECGMKSVALIETKDVDATVSYRFLGSVLVRPGRLIALSKLGKTELTRHRSIL